MTEKIIKKENVEYKLTCSLFMEWNRPAKYRFKLQQSIDLNYSKER